MGKDAELPVGIDDLRGRELQGRFRIDELVHATPWRAGFAGWEHDTKRAIVVEVVRPSQVHDQGTEQRFERRITACGRVRHPVIQGPIASGALPDGKLYVVSERPPGEPLDRHLQREPSGRLAWPDARALLLELVRGLGAAHARKVVHGSLSASCCWVDRPDFGTPVVRVLGTGASTSPAADDPELAHTRTTALAHDAVFMAPETAGCIFGDERSDVYLTGLLAWFMLVGRAPFQAPNSFKLAAMHLTAPVPSMRAAGVEVPAGVEELVASMLAKKPKQRIGGMAEVEEALLGLGGEGELRDARSAAVPEGAKGRGRARARQAGGSSREEAMQRLSGRDGVVGQGRGAVPRLPGQGIVDPRGAEEWRRSGPTRQAVAAVYPEPWGAMPPPPSPMPDVAQFISLANDMPLTGFEGGAPAMPSFPRPQVEATEILEIRTAVGVEEMQIYTLSPEQAETLRRAYEAGLRNGGSG